MASLQYGGSLGFTSDFNSEPVSPNSIPIMWVRVGGSGFLSGALGFIEVWVTSVGSTAGGPTGILYSLFVKYWNGLTNAFVTTSSVQVIAIASLGDIDPITNQSTYQPSPQQTVELSWTSATEDSVTHLFTADGTIQVKVGGSTVINLSSLPLYHGTEIQWKWIGLASQSFTSSIYVLDRSGFCTGYGGTFATSASYQLQYPGPTPLTIPLTAPNQTAASCTTAGANALYSANMNDETAGTFFSPPGPWVQSTFPATTPTLGAGTVTWGGTPYASTDARQFLLCHTRGFIYNAVAFVPPPVGGATLIVTKLTVPPDSPVVFDFAAGGGLDPATFSLSHGESQSYNDVDAGSGYSIAETVPLGWRVAYFVSNGSPIDNITIGANETVRVTVTDTNTNPPGFAVNRQIIRRLRRAPHLAQDAKRLYIRSFQVILQPGLGAVTGQGVDPQVMVRVSYDGGKTFGYEQWLSAGELGHYRKRVIAYQLGEARDALFEVVVSDPIAWYLTAAFLNIDQGYL